MEATEGNLINLMHTRYMNGLRDLCTVIGGNMDTMQKHVDLANKLSTINARHYVDDWGKSPNPQKILELSTSGNISITNVPQT